ncbi:hypothetical protein HZS_3350, partial [Henneguya salminicola]
MVHSIYMTCTYYNQSIQGYSTSRVLFIYFSFIEAMFHLSKTEMKIEDITFILESENEAEKNSTGFKRLEKDFMTHTDAVKKFNVEYDVDKHPLIFFATHVPHSGYYAGHTYRFRITIDKEYPFRSPK